MRNGSCGYGVDCKYHHPDPIYDPYEQHGNGYGFDYQHQSFGNMNGEYYPNAPLMTDSTVQPTINAWNGNQVSYLSRIRTVLLNFTNINIMYSSSFFCQKVSNFQRFTSGNGCESWVLWNR